MYLVTFHHLLCTIDQPIRIPYSTLILSELFFFVFCFYADKVKLFWNVHLLLLDSRATCNLQSNLSKSESEIRNTQSISKTLELYRLWVNVLSYIYYWLYARVDSLVGFDIQHCLIIGLATSN